jgi:hypothetical protein
VVAGEYHDRNFGACGQNTENFLDQRVRDLVALEKVTRNQDRIYGVFPSDGQKPLQGRETGLAKNLSLIAESHKPGANLQVCGVKEFHLLSPWILPAAR